MNRSTNLFLTLLFILSSAWSYGQNKQTLNLRDFREISLGVSGEIFVKQGNQTEVIIEASERRKEGLEIEVEGDRLVIKSNNRWNWKNWGSDDNLTMYITMKEVEELSVSSSGRIIGQGLIKGNDLKLSVSGSGRINLQAAVEDLSSSISGSGRIDVEGSSRSNDVRISGSGRLTAEELDCETYDVSISGSGNCRINVSKSINARISGSGRVYYRGNPDYVNTHASGSGGIRKI